MNLKTEEITLRDPFVLVHDGKYYLYGTRSLTCWGEADGFDVYVGNDLENWEGPIEVFHRPEGFKYDKNYWAPEVHEFNGAFYMFATFNSVAEDKKGTMILRSESPLGPFVPWSEGKITPEEWNCLDGTFYVNPEGIPYMIFSHEWVDILDGEMWAVKLSLDLKRPEGKPFKLFSASEGKGWVKAISHKDHPGRQIFVTDGPFLWRQSDGKLLLLWASFGEHGYVEAVAESDNGDITGNWIQWEEPVYTENGGHGMLFRNLSGKLLLTLHFPNTKYQEHPVFIETKLSE